MMEPDYPYVVFLTDRDGGEVGYEEFETVAELLREWPYAVKETEYTYNADAGGRA